ncbi:MAG: DUF934 domain-containing protein [Pedobacter sp.]|nr:DUF934 domain-containing protein [Pedobacter sp.]
MPKLIKDGAIVDDGFTFANPAEDGSFTLPAGPVLVKLATWQAHRDALLAHPHAKGVQLAPAEFAEEIASDLDKLALIAIEFPGFADGRGYSTAHLLRGRLGFKGELRAVGDVFKDTLFYQQRCGFNAFAVKEGKSLEDALEALHAFQTPYQGSAEKPGLLFRTQA